MEKYVKIDPNTVEVTISKADVVSTKPLVDLQSDLQIRIYELTKKVADLHIAQDSYDQLLVDAAADLADLIQKKDDLGKAAVGDPVLVASAAVSALP